MNVSSTVTLLFPLIWSSPTPKNVLLQLLSLPVNFVYVQFGVGWTEHSELTVAIAGNNIVNVL